MKRYHLDTNVLIDLYGAKKSAPFFTTLIGTSEIELETSVICIVEFLSKANATEETWLKNWVKTQELQIIYLDSLTMASQIAHLRKQSAIKTPDAIVLATAMERRAQLLTFDRELYIKAKQLLACKLLP